MEEACTVPFGRPSRSLVSALAHVLLYRSETGKR